MGGVTDRKDLRCSTGKYINKIGTRSGWMVDKVELWCTDGSYQKIGGEGGGYNNPFVCDSGFDEIRVKAGEKIDGIQFKCSDGRWSDWWGGQGGAEYKRKCEDNKVITGFFGLGTRDNMVAPATEISNILECGNRVDCYNDSNLFHPECKTKSDEQYKQKVANFCNSSDINARSEGCLNWCKENSTRCGLLNDLNDCSSLGISRPDCTRQRINDLQNECSKYKIIMSALGTGEYPCSPNSIIKLKEECKSLGIPDESCSPTEITAEKDRKVQEELVKQSQLQAQQRYEEAQAKSEEKFKQTQALIAQTIGIPIQQKLKKEKVVNKISDDSQMSYIIIITIIIFILLLSLSSSSLLFLTSNE